VNKELVEQGIARLNQVIARQPGANQGSGRQRSLKLQVAESSGALGGFLWARDPSLVSQSIDGLEDGLIPSRTPQQIDRGRANLGDSPWRLIFRHRAQNMDTKIGRQQTAGDQNPAGRRGSRLVEQPEATSMNRLSQRATDRRKGTIWEAFNFGTSPIVEPS
jgi:hypothetical protein